MTVKPQDNNVYILQIILFCKWQTTEAERHLSPVSYMQFACTFWHVCNNNEWQICTGT